METTTKKLLYFLILPLLLLSTVVYIALFQMKPDFQLHVNFFDDATLIRTYENHKVIIDGGPDNKILSLIGNQLPFYDHTIDLLILTKVDAAHVSGLTDLLRKYQVKMVLIPESNANLAVYWEFLKLVEQNHVKKLFMYEGQRVWLDDATVLDIYQLDEFSAKLSFGKTEITFPATEKGERVYKN